MLLRHRTGRSGTAAVEFAVASPVLFMLIFGIFEFCRVQYTQHLLHHAAREGARYATCHADDVVIDELTFRSTEEHVRDEVVLPALGGVTLDNQQIEIYQSDSGGERIGPHRDAEFGEFIACEVSGRYRPLLPVVGAFDVRIRSVMRSEAN